MRVKFLHISDLHFSFSYDKGDERFCRMMKKMTPPLEQVKKLFDDVEKDFDFVCVTGDICEYGTVEEYRFIHDWLEAYFGCKVIGVSGNHENKKAFMQGFLGKENCDPLYEEHDINGFRVICFDSSDENANDGLITSDSCNLLRKSLEEKDIPTIVLTHHHLISSQFDMPVAQYGNEFREIIRNSNILAVLNGHTHHSYEGNFEGKPYYTAGSLSFVCECINNELNCYEHASAQRFVYDNGILSKTIYEEKNDPHFIDRFSI